MTGVSPATKPGMAAGVIPSTPAQALALSGFACRNATIACGLQLATRWVPPNRPGAPPDTVPPCWVAGFTLGRSVPTDGENGLAPVKPTGSNRTWVGLTGWL